MDVYCINCGSKMPGTAKFCVSCGTEVYRPKTEPLATEALQQAGPDTPYAIEPSCAATPQISVTTAYLDGSAKEQRPKNAVTKVTYATTALYFTVVAAALLLHQHANAEAKIVKDVEETQAQLVDLVFTRSQRSPRMLELLKWPEGASDGSVEGFIRRSDELAPLLSHELAAGKRVHEQALQVLGANTL
jgi:ribosomal protein L40E